ncbi:hypothetical protein BHM03_00019312 [Ensete ventricosum]|nr:hypothetical protein BHM03_00019312 [Ensete ventricosum]
MYTRIVLRISQIYRGKIILFSKGCPDPSFPFCVVVVVAGLPFGLALVAANRPLTGGLSCGLTGPVWGLAVAGLPSSLLGREENRR